MNARKPRLHLVLGLIPGLACREPAPPFGADTVATETSTGPDAPTAPTTAPGIKSRQCDKAVFHLYLYVPRVTLYVPRVT